ncbi:MAG: transposase [Saprospiraceae bacterium]|nr:transposase [Candidatus Brachybacter algidus]
MGIRTTLQGWWEAKCTIACPTCDDDTQEGNGWSDEQLFDYCRFNIRCMRALGLYHVGDDIPVESTYYEFRRRLTEHNKNEKVDLVGKAFSNAVRGQIEAFNLRGEKVRMDSKLIQSNIRRASRLDLILETVRVSITYLELRCSRRQTG